MVYFIGTEDKKYVKIGYCNRDPQGRVSTLQIGCPLEIKLIGTMSGNMADEVNLHRKFLPYHIRGEWFKLSDEIKQFIDCGVMPVDEVYEFIDDIRFIPAINILDEGEDIGPELNEWLGKMRIIIDNMRTIPRRVIERMEI